MSNIPPENRSDGPADDEGLGQPTYDEVVDEIAESPSVGEPPEPAKTPEIYSVTPPTSSSTESRAQRHQRLIPVLQLIMRDQRIEEILPQLSPEHQRLLELRFDLNTGRRRRSHSQIARILKMDKHQVARLEAEVLDEVSHLADLPPGDNK